MRATRSTARLLWAACRPTPRPESVTAAVDGGADVPRAARLVMPQYAGPLLWQALEAAGRLDRLGSARTQLHTDFEIHRGRAALLVPGALATAVEPLMRAGLEPVVLKGPALATRYPQPALRPMDDIDLLLPADQHDFALAALVGAGWQIRYAEFGHDYDTVLEHPSLPHLPLELHRGLESWRDRSHGLSARELWARRTPVECMGVTAFSLPVEDELVVLAAHAAKPFHHFQRLIWFVDMAVAIRAAGPALDWGTVAERARDARCATALALALRHARRLGANVPDEVLTVPSGGWRHAALAPVLDETWPLVAASARTGHRLRYALPDAHRDRALLTLGEVAARGPLHAPSRAMQLVAKVVRRVRQRPRPDGAAGHARRQVHR